uniref:EPS8 like 3 n=1 Tax=Cairina moschata TaxID=8855 RepID=A0A8C3CUV0_CAIMO
PSLPWRLPQTLHPSKPGTPLAVAPAALPHGTFPRSPISPSPPAPGWAPPPCPLCPYNPLRPRGQEELESYPLGSVRDCAALLDACSYDSVLAISVQEQAPPGTSVLLFQCDRIGVRQGTGVGGGWGGCAPGWEGPSPWAWAPSAPAFLPPGVTPPHPPGGWAPSEQLGQPLRPDHVRHRPRRGKWHPVHPHPHIPPVGPPGSPGPMLLPQMVLNHVLDDVELFVKQVKDALSLMSTKNQKKKKKSKGGKGGGASYKDFFQKVKYALNLLVGLTRRDTTPRLWGIFLLHLIFDTLSFVLDNCPNPRLAPAVDAPLLIPEAVELLEKTLHPHEYSTWKMLGIAWNKTRWALVLPLPHGRCRGRTAATVLGGIQPGLGAPLGAHCPPSFRPFSPPPRLARALYEFQGRNPQELSVRMGDTLEVLDQQKKWWLVQNSMGHKGYVPSNILEPLGGVRGSPPQPLSLCPPSQVSPPNLHMGSSPAEVTAWLKDKGFSRITVRCLGVLLGHQLLQMTPEELRAVCPEEWRRVLFKLSSVKTSLGVRPPSPRTVTPPPVGVFREQGCEPRAPRSILVLPSLQMSPRD